MTVHVCSLHAQFKRMVESQFALALTKDEMTALAVRVVERVHLFPLLVHVLQAAHRHSSQCVAAALRAQCVAASI
jgi:hypothetical protein